MDVGDVFRIPKFRAFLNDDGRTWAEFTANGRNDLRGRGRRLFVVMVLGIEPAGDPRLDGNAVLEGMGWTRPCAERTPREPCAAGVAVPLNLLRDAIEALARTPADGVNVSPQIARELRAILDAEEVV